VGVIEGGPGGTYVGRSRSGSGVIERPRAVLT
jgi:hypothetical protein